MTPMQQIRILRSRPEWDYLIYYHYHYLLSIILIFIIILIIIIIIEPKIVQIQVPVRI
jgi:hypothetical protein